MRKIFCIALAVVLAVAGMTVNVGAAAPMRREAALTAALDWIMAHTPDGAAVGSVLGEWAVMALAKAGRVDANDPWTELWLADLDATLAQIDAIQTANPHIDISHPPSVGTFPSALRRWTDFQRVALALDALGMDAANYNGRDLTAPFRAFVPTAQRHALNRTITADMYALIALETVGGHGDLFLANLLSAQRADGTWSLNPAQPTSVFDIDTTAMAVQALAPFLADARAAQAVEWALEWLRAQIFPDPESTAQMIVALIALGEDYALEAAFYVQWLLRWYNSALGGFVRSANPGAVNAVATVQAAYALAAYDAFVHTLGAEPVPLDLHPMPAQETPRHSGRST